MPLVGVFNWAVLCGGATMWMNHYMASLALALLACLSHHSTSIGWFRSPGFGSRFPFRTAKWGADLVS